MQVDTIPPAARPAREGQQSAPKVYFKNLDGIRFLAAGMVLLQHMSDYKVYAGVAANAERPFVSALGGYGVNLFFVLSGFLIFYLLFTEKKHTGTVSIRDFYMRRVLRIWPLYFLFGLGSILGIEWILNLLGATADTPVMTNLLFLFTFSVNLQLVFMAANKGVIELYWSVCIEEQFYLFAPWLVKKANRYMPWIIGGLIATGIGTKFLLHYLYSTGTITFPGHGNPIAVFTTTWFDAFGMGIAAAYLYFNKHLYRRIQGFIENKWIQAAVVGVTLLYVTNILKPPAFVSTYLFSTVPAFLFAYIVLAASTGRFLVNLEKPLLKTMGRVSYGIYIFHAIIAQGVLFLFLKLFGKNNMPVYEFLYPLTCLVAVGVVAWLSFEWYEKRFLKMKKRFTVVQNQKI
ncbi:MAG TPA: acyltransferase [Chitinophagaceae bacterium]|jgi:peptidoglycan/LPS O-acetylase OafA/YrhL|nr:acyltransferase [Chitinophagaceae bacterium]